MKPYYLLFFSLVVPAGSQAQMFSFGVTGGVPAQTPIGRADGGLPFAVGPTVNVRIFSRLSLETGVMFQSMGRSEANGAFIGPSNSFTLSFTSQKAHAIEVPLLAKFYVLKGRQAWKPFVTAGPAVRRTSLDGTFFSSTYSGSPLTGAGPSPVSSKQSQWNVDPEVGIGVDMKAGRFHMDPEVRYSYWGAGKDMYPVRKNQVQFLMGFRF
jgi:hypothetical protein